MIHSTAIFSIADLNGNIGYLYGTYRYGKRTEIVELLEENEDDGKTYCRIKTRPNELDGHEWLTTNRIYDTYHSDKKVW